MTSAAAAELRWRLKESFLQYVEAISDHSTELDGVIRIDGAFHFPFDPSKGPSSAGHWQFSGSLTIRAHRGMMHVPLSDPVVDVSGGGPTLSVDTGRGGRLIIADLEMVREDHDSCTFAVRLLPDGVEMFGGVYVPGTHMGELSVHGLQIIRGEHA